MQRIERAQSAVLCWCSSNIKDVEWARLGFFSAGGPLSLGFFSVFSGSAGSTALSRRRSRRCKAPFPSIVGEERNQLDSLICGIPAIRRARIARVRVGGGRLVARNDGGESGGHGEEEEGDEIQHGGQE